MEAVALSGLLGLGYLISRVSQSKSGPQPNANMNPSYAAFKTNEGFIPAARGINSDPLTVAPKGASAVGFGPDRKRVV